MITELYNEPIQPIASLLCIFQIVIINSHNFHNPLFVGLTNNRKILVDDGRFKITDVNWYLTKLLPVFNQGDTLVEYFTYEEHI